HSSHQALTTGAYTEFHRMLAKRLGWLSLRRSLPLFLAIVVGLAIWQTRLTWLLMEQDRNLAAQRSRERLEQVADLAVAQLAGTLSDWELSVRELDTMPPPAALQARLSAGGTFILLKRGSVATYPSKPLLFVPEPPPATRELSNDFDSADGLEFQEQRYDQAILVLRPLTGQSATRPEALLRLARLERKLNRAEAALGTYQQLTHEGAVSWSGVPYALLAAGARCEVLGGVSDSRRLMAEAESLRTALLAGKWPLRRDTFEYYWSEQNRLRRASGDPPRDLLEFSSLVSDLYDQWQRAVRSDDSGSGRGFQRDSRPLVWHATPSHLAALLAPPAWLTSNLKLPANAMDIRWTLLPVKATVGPQTHVLRSLSEVGLPGRLEFRSITADSNRGVRPVLWLAGVVLMLVLVLAGAYTMYRGVNRELRVAQLQSDFVSAVSHEFRSPLTTLRSITELLAQDRISDEPRRRQSYVFLERETGRLQHLVEDLLDFGRMESGRKQYRIRPHDLFALVRAAVTDFREDTLANGFQIEVNLEPQGPTVQADDEALRRAIRNLLENAVKYSPECRTIWVDGAVNGHHATIAVRDRGMGIERAEQREIFQKFVRGAAAKKAGIKGTGIGLSMVRQIIEAMGGQIRLESTAGAGSTFTVLLPLVKEATS
ncbi:MAG: HAMP domain-containing histidine kinase, partial [Acidobacteriota bacterium]|nr:HAMP domain-containing histidine kinase [Acidobacteriota bacterium]